MTDAIINKTKLNDITNFGLRASVGVIFLAHGLGKLDPQFIGFLTGQLGFAPEMQIPIALAEIIPGILLITGILTRVSASMLCVIMLGAIFYVKKATNLIGQGGYEFDLILLAASLVIITAGPGKISLAQIIKKLPSYVH